MSTRYGTEPTHLLITGSETPRLQLVIDAFTAAGVQVTVRPVLDPAEQLPKVTTLVVAARIDTEMQRRDWDGVECDVYDTVEQALPRLASLSTVLIVAYTTHDDPGSRREIRGALSSLCEQLAATDSMRAGIDLTINALETPAGLYDHAVADALTRHLRRRSFLNSGAVIPVEDLAHGSITDAITNDFI